MGHRLRTSHPADLTAPIEFVAVGALLGATGLIDAPTAPETRTPVVEIALMWILFSDAARVPVQLRRMLVLVGSFNAIEGLVADRPRHPDHLGVDRVRRRGQVH